MVFAHGTEQRAKRVGVGCFEGVAYAALCPGCVACRRATGVLIGVTVQRGRAGLGEGWAY